MKSPYLKQWYWNFQQFSQGSFARISKKIVLEQTAVQNRLVFSITQGEEIFTERWKLGKHSFRPAHGPSTKAFFFIPSSHMQEPHFPLEVSLEWFSDQAESQSSHPSSLCICWIDDRSSQLWSKNLVTPSMWDNIHKHNFLLCGRAPVLAPSVFIIPSDCCIPGRQEGRWDSLTSFPKVP